MRDEFVQLGVDDSPEGPLLRRPLPVLGVQERDVENFLSVVASVFADRLVLEVRVLDVAVLFELSNVDASLGHSSRPTVVGQGHGIPESLDAAFKHFEVDALNQELHLHLLHLLLNLRVNDTGSEVFTLLAHIAPEQKFSRERGFLTF